MGPVAAVRDDRGYFGYELRKLVVPAEGTAFAVPPYSLRLLDCLRIVSLSGCSCALPKLLT
jgi:hypothetical protein